MKATGIVRRIDDLGRVVIPKEIRRTMHIRQGAPLEIFTNDDGDVIFRKYSPLGEFTRPASQCAEALGRITKYPVYICDREHIVAATGPNRRELTGQKVASELDILMQERSEAAGQQIPLVFNRPDTVNVVAFIIASSDVIGCVALSVPQQSLSQNIDSGRKFAELAAAFLGAQTEE